MASRWGTVTFEAQATNDIHVSFNKDTSRVEGRDGLADQSPNYEVVIGGTVTLSVCVQHKPLTSIVPFAYCYPTLGWMNRKTAVRKRGQQQAAARKEENPNAVITSPHFTQYWFLLDNGTTVVATNRIFSFSELSPPEHHRTPGLLVVGKGEPGSHEIIVRPARCSTSHALAPALAHAHLGVSFAPYSS